MLNSVDVWYCTREDVQRALDVKSTARSSQQIDRIIGEVSRQIEVDLGRIFYPLQTTRQFDWPQLPYSGAFPWRLWLDQHELISVTQITTGGEVLTSGEYFLYPVNTGPPFNRLEINLGTNAAFASAETWQLSISIQGIFGYDLKTDPAGALAANVLVGAGTLDLLDSSNVGVGSVLLVGSEYMRVTNRQTITTGQTLQAPNLTAVGSNDAVGVTDGTKYAPWEVLTIDTERMLIVDTVGNTLVVKRAWDGTTLAAHTAGATIFASRRMAVTRGDLGSTAAPHTLGDVAATVHVPVRGLAIAECEFRLLSEESGMNKSSGSGDTLRALDVTALADVRMRYFTRYGRKVRMRSI